MMKFRKLKQEANSLDLYIYSEVTEDEYNWWTGETVESTTSAEYIRKTLEKAGDVTNINLYINSLGGSVKEGVAIYNQLRRSKAFKTVYIDGFACSIATVIAMAGDKVVMPKNTTMMIHNAWMYCAGNAQQLRKAAEDLDTINEASRQAFLVKAKGKLSEEDLAAMMDRETYLTAKQCLEYGLADEYAEADADLEEAQDMLQKATKTRQYKACAEKLIALAQEPPRELEPTEPGPKPEEPAPEEVENPEPGQPVEKAEKLIRAMMQGFNTTQNQ